MVLIRDLGGCGSLLVLLGLCLQGNRNAGHTSFVPDITVTMDLLTGVLLFK